MNIIAWIVSEKLAVNNFAAAHIANGLKLAGLPEDEQKRRVEEYRKWRITTQDAPKACYQYVLEGKQPPAEMFEVKASTEIKECGACNGTGKYSNGFECGHCFGKGVIECLRFESVTEAK